jgi:hypothetical protein
VVDAEAAAVTISGTSTGLADGQVVTVYLDGVSVGTAVIATNAWSLADVDFTEVANGAHTVTAKSPTSALASRAITRADA